MWHREVTWLNDYKLILATYNSDSDIEKSDDKNKIKWKNPIPFIHDPFAFVCCLFIQILIQTYIKEIKLELKSITEWLEKMSKH